MTTTSTPLNDPKAVARKHAQNDCCMSVPLLFVSRIIGEAQGAGSGFAPAWFWGFRTDPAEADSRQYYLNSMSCDYGMVRPFNEPPFNAGGIPSRPSTRRAGRGARGRPDYIGREKATPEDPADIGQIDALAIGAALVSARPNAGAMKRFGPSSAGSGSLGRGDAMRFWRFGRGYAGRRRARRRRSP